MSVPCNACRTLVQTGTATEPCDASDQNRRAMRTLHDTLQTGTGTFDIVK